MNANQFSLFIIFSLVCITITTSIPPSLGVPPKGGLALDIYTFDKIIRNYNGRVLVKFDRQYPFGEKEDEYKKLLERFNARVTATTGSARLLDGLLVTQVSIGEFGEKENDALRQFFKLEKEMYPVYMIFDKDPNQPVARYNGDIKVDSLAMFINANSKVWLGLPGCVESLDKIAKEFNSATVNNDAQSQANLIKQAEEQIKLMTANGDDAEEVENAQQYITIMKKLVDKKDFLDVEHKRIDKLLKGKIAEKQKQKLNNRKNILSSFATAPTSTTSGGDNEKEL